MLAVVIAFAANILVATAKSIAAALTGSAAMLAEAAHSWADAGNEVFLLIAERRSARAADERHPLGYGREAYVWSLFAAVGVFTVGAAVSVMHGVQGLFEPEAASDYLVAYLVLAASFVIEGISLTQSVVQARRTAREYQTDPVRLVLDGSDPTIRAVIAEDAAALVGIAIAAGALVLHEVTGSAVWDALGSIAIGLLLGVVAVLLIQRNHRFLVGTTPPERYRTGAIEALLANASIERVTYLHLEFIGPRNVYLVAAVDLAGDRPEGEVAALLRDLEQAIERENRIVRTAVLTLSVADEPSIEL